MQSALLPLCIYEKLFEQRHPKQLWVPSFHNTWRQDCVLLAVYAN